jgi:hypothetical protein
MCERAEDMIDLAASILVSREEECRSKYFLLAVSFADGVRDARFAGPGASRKPVDRWRVQVLEPVVDILQDSLACAL